MVVLDAVRDRFDLTTITSGRREGDTGVHGVGRGADLRCRDINLGKVVEDYVNSLWIYDPSRPDKKVCWCHDTGRGLHLHFQVHPKTVRRT
ncbi:hypothetical protein KAR91_34515 [Candidatus Pacearchaeota archaeon]|nr:hypothetical protein [Candidatus Pacearchaeota archaeon]